MQRTIVCLQNHDQVGNRANGERLHHQIDAASWRAASVVLLTAPTTPLIFMGQEWAASTPFLYFTDLDPWFGRSVTEGRRREFKDFPGFDPTREVADPQSPDTFEASRLRWEERTEPSHAASLALYTTLLALRGNNPALHASQDVAGEAWPAGGSGLVIRRSTANDTFLVVAQLRGAGDVRHGEHVPDGKVGTVVLSTEDPQFALDPQPPEITPAHIRFTRPGAVVLRLA
jgi:maltooligosyltrehalose trehalohydrolase